MNTLEEILKEANKYLRPLPEEADPTKMNEEDNIRSIKKRETLEPIERAEFEPTRELKRAEDIRSIDKQNYQDRMLMRERLEPIERAEIEPMEFQPREFKRAEDIRSIEMAPMMELKEFEKMTPRRNLQPMRAPEEFEDIEFEPRELKRAEDTRSIERVPKQEFKEFEKMTPRMYLQPMRVPEETFEDMQLSPLGSGAIMRAQQFMIPEYDPEDQIMYDDIQREQLEYQRRLDYRQKLRERK